MGLTSHSWCAAEPELKPVPWLQTRAVTETSPLCCPHLSPGCLSCSTVPPSRVGAGVSILYPLDVPQRLAQNGAQEMLTE